MKNELSVTQKETLLQTLATRFKENMPLNQGMEWVEVHEKLKANTDKLWVLHKIEETGGEPDVVEYDEEKSAYVFYDCSKETPKHRRSVCYDREALEERKKYPPQNTVVDMVSAIGIELLTEEQYRKVQSIEAFDLNTSSWVHTPPEIRERGGALFCDCRYGQVYVYDHGASAYHSKGGCRG